MTQAALLLQLLRLPNVGPVAVRHLLAGLARIGVPLERIFELTEDRLALDLGLSCEQIQALFHPTSEAEEDLRLYREMEIDVLLSSDSRYPWSIISLLGRTAPPLLFGKGNLELLQMPALGVSGSRRACENSLGDVTRLCETLGSEGWVIISGGARGTDEAAHLAAVRSGPGTIVVLPTGVLRPNLRKELTKHLEAGKALLISEFFPEQGWTVGCAMQRNRILVALSRAIVVVEPGSTGGTGGTGRIAQKLGVPLFVLESDHKSDPTADEFLRTGAHLLSLQGALPRQLSHRMQQAWENAQSMASKAKMQSNIPL